MSVPSEILAAHVLEKLGFKNVKFVDKSYDFVAVEGGETVVIEAKSEGGSFSWRQIKSLAKKWSENKRAYVIFVGEEAKYALFLLEDTNLFKRSTSEKQEKIDQELVEQPEHKLWLSFGKGFKLYCPSTKKVTYFNFEPTSQPQNP